MQKESDLYDQEFRDTISTVDQQGKRVWIYPKKPSGKFHSLRIVVTIILLSILFLAPLIKMNGQPLLLFNFFERKFIIFGVAFWPQDFHLFVIATIALFVFIILFTVIFGRVWCGWACPQTIFMEMVFRKIEYWIEGDATKQKKLDKQPWNREKIIKKGSKHLIFILISVLIAHTLMSYLVGFDQVKQLVSQPPAENLAGFLGLVFFTGLFYWIFSYFREQACIAVCPYGRLQGVLLGKDSIVVAYDWIRGEPRGKLNKGKIQEGNGDCINCHQCVHVCPTGIDIRNGTQLECVNCTACIDACDFIMEKVDRPKGLIRYASYNGIKEGKKSLFTPRVAGYSGLLLLLIILFSYLLTTRSDVEATVMRVPGQLYQEQENGQISNLYNIQFVNKTFDPIELELRLQNQDQGTIRKIGESGIMVPASGSTDGIFFIDLPRESVQSTKTGIVIELVKDGEVIDEVKTNFLGPVTVKK